MAVGRISRAAVVLAALVFASAASFATTFTLDELVNGSVDSFESGNGLLTFSDFEVRKLKKLSGNLALYTITVLEDGFMLSSPEFEATSGGLKKLNLTYKVSANTGEISGASLTMDATRVTGRVKVEKDIEDPTGDEGTFLLTLLRKHRAFLNDADDFGPGVTSLEVEEAIRIKKISTLHSVTNTYTVVAEPTELSLLATGLGGLAWIGRRRRSARAPT